MRINYWLDNDALIYYCEVVYETLDVQINFAEFTGVDGFVLITPTTFACTRVGLRRVEELHVRFRQDYEAPGWLNQRLKTTVERLIQSGGSGISAPAPRPDIKEVKANLQRLFTALCGNAAVVKKVCR